MSWILGMIYCGVIWLVFAKLKWIRLSLPLAILLASIGPGLIVVLLFCAQYFHPYTPAAIVLQHVDPIVPQLSRPGRVTAVPVEPNRAVREGEILFQVDRIPYENAEQRAITALAEAEQNVKVAESAVKLNEAALKRADANLAYATTDRDRTERLRESNSVSADEFEKARTLFEQAQATLTQTEESLKQSQLAVELARQKVTQAQIALDDARYDLQQTTVLAPANGYVVNLQLRSGMLVSSSTGAVMTFVRDPKPEEEGVVVATFAEKNFLRIRAGQYAEVAMDAYPGEILTGRVQTPIGISGTGQLTTEGVLPKALLDGTKTLYAVRIRLDHADRYPLPGGAQGQAAVFTDDVQIAGIPVMFLIRAKSWMNYLF